MNNLAKFPIEEIIFYVKLVERPLLDRGDNQKSMNTSHFSD